MMKLPIRNFLAEPLTLFIEPHCQQHDIPVGGSAVVTLPGDWLPAIDVAPDRWITLWEEGPGKIVVEVFDDHSASRRASAAAAVGAGGSFAARLSAAWNVLVRK